MTDEEKAELERVARLRGHDPTRYLNGDAERSLPRAPVRLGLGQVFRFPHGFDTSAELLRTFDHLPEASRRFLRDSPVNMNAQIWAMFLAACNGQETPLIEATARILPQIVAEQCARKYGRWPTHPQARGAT